MSAIQTSHELAMSIAQMDGHHTLAKDVIRYGLELTGGDPHQLKAILHVAITHITDLAQRSRPQKEKR
jgi:hypothetical protein